MKEDGRIKSGHDVAGESAEVERATVCIRHSGESRNPASLVFACRYGCLTIVIPAKAGIQLHALRRFKLDSAFRGNDEALRGHSRTT
ncbi:MAG TPA: hypothetical protein VKA79_10035 [Aestuariivirgaceae bacterium]|nr:hypothetical protein [Aestuariivirgaceae bacterium]